MSLLSLNFDPTSRQLRQFSTALLVFAVVIAAILWNHEAITTSVFVGGTGCGLALIGLVYPKTIRPLFIALLVLTHPIGWIISHTVLLTFYYLIFTPVGLLMRVLKYDPLKRKYDHEAKTYWIKRDQSSDVTRYFKQY